jgi:hypothetical protein
MADEEKKGVDVTKLVYAELEKLTDAQIRAVQRIGIDRDNKSAREKVAKALEEEDKKIAEAMTSQPYVYESPKIKVMAGCEVTYSSLMRVQLKDAHRQLDEFVAKDNPNDVRAGDLFNEVLLAHSLTTYNGVPFGGVLLNAADYQELRRTDPKAADDLLNEVRDKRREAIEALSPHIVQRLIECYQAFQFHIEDKTRDAGEILGN